MHLVFEGTVIFRTKQGQLEIGAETLPLSWCRLDWLAAFSGRLDRAPSSPIIIDLKWLRCLSYNTTPERLFSDYILPYEKFANLLGHDRLITRPGKEKKTETVGSILAKCRCLF